MEIEPDKDMFEQVKEIVRKILEKRPDAGLQHVHEEAPEGISLQMLGLAMYDVCGDDRTLIDPST